MNKVISSLEMVGQQRYRESHGLYYEDFEIGDIYEHRPGRTITATDNIWLSLLCLNTHPLHINTDYAAKTEFKQLVVSSLITFAIIGGLSLASTSARGIANLGWSNVRFSKPVFVDDTIYAVTKILSKRLSKSRNNQGIVRVQTSGIKSNGDTFMTCERRFLIPCRKGL